MTAKQNWFAIVLVFVCLGLIAIARAEHDENVERSTRVGHFADSLSRVSVRLGIACARALDDLKPLEQGAFVIVHPWCEPALDTVANR